ncbi:dihydrofolate reductase family protein [Nocardioides speluncae]|uniref:dihydrofolate reductase family protein n=1 Tax=Nocardioides speluncae TaxID=2670337 RepID=UPI000D688ADD|nr:dihydrofolate reductase family protein [Nocardioides speluncae]
MKKLIVVNLISLDGYAAGEGGNVYVMPLDESFSEYNAEAMRGADTLLYGADTYRGMLGYWPDIEADEEQPAVEREISSYCNSYAKVVVSDSLTTEDTGVWAGSTEVVSRADAHRRIAELKQGEGRDIVMFGSTVVWNDLLAAGLIDELHFQVGAGAVGSGVPAFQQAFGGHAFDGSLTLLEARQLAGSPNVLLRYAVSA